MAAVIDLFSRRVIGWSMSQTMTAQPVTDVTALNLTRPIRHAQTKGGAAL